jgi:hypothetical protein
VQEAWAQLFGKKHIEWFGLRENPQDHPIFNGNITKYMETSMVNAFH